MEGKRKIAVINIVSIIMLVMCLAISVVLIVLAKSKTEVEIGGTSAEKLKNNYTTTEETSNTWDVSANEDGSVMATLANDGTLTISGTGEMKDWSDDSDVAWYSERDKIKKIIIENGITNIGSYAFYYCVNLASIEISSSVTSIGDRTFEFCTSLKSIEIPSGVTSVGVNPFYNCTNLTNINVNENNASYKDENGVLYTKDGTKIITYPIGKNDTEYTILNGTTHIGISAFYHCTNLTSIKIPSSVTSIRGSAFNYCTSLASIEIPDSVEIIGSYAFYHCTSLTSIKIPSSVTSIEYRAFEDCYSLMNLEIKVSSNAEIVNDAFKDSLITQLAKTTDKFIELPEILKRIQDENDILYSSSEFELTNCTIEDSKIKIDEGANYAGIEVVGGVLNGLEYTILKNSWDISENEDKSAIAVISDDGILTITGTGNIRGIADNEYYLARNFIKKINIEEGITNIPSEAFVKCDNLIKVTISSTVASIEEIAFGCCNNLKIIEVDEKNTNYIDENGVLYTKDKTKIVKYPEAKGEKNYNILNTVTTIEDGAFAYCNNLENIQIPNRVEKIEMSAFAYCNNLENIQISNSVANIGDAVFWGCYNLTEIIIPNSVTNIGEDVFEYCNNLTIICKDESVAKTYAQENEINYLIIMDGINPKTTVSEIGQNLENVTNYEITDKNEAVITPTEYVKTGYRVTIADGENYIIIVTGDCNGDGEADIKDILAINKHRLNKSSLEMEYSLASDVNEDGKVDQKDILQINKFRLGKIKEL